MSASRFYSLRALALAAMFGAATLLSPVSTRAAILLNEVYANVPGSGDLNQEYIELISTTGGVESGSGYAVLLIDCSGGGKGTLRDAFELTPTSTGSNGLLLLENNFSTGPWTGTWDTNTTRYDPVANDAAYSAMGDDDIENNAFTCLLVTNYTGTVGTDYDTNDDGVLDASPWTVVDSVGWNQSGPVDFTYSPTNLSQTGYTPDSVARIRGNTSANSASAWYGGDILGPSTSSVTYDVQNFGLGAGYKMTPGYDNYPVPVPEPSSMVLAGLGSLAAALVARRKLRAAR